MASPPPTRWAPRYCCRRNIWIPIVFHPCANVGNGILHTDPNTKVIQTAILLPVCGWVMWHDRVLFFTRSQHPTGDAMTPRPASTSTAEVVRQAVALLDAEGPDAFSMRKLGAAMGVDPMTVYHHVPNKAALFDLVVDELWSGLAPAVDGGWQQQVASLAHELRRVLLEHPRLVQLVGTRPMVTPRLLGLADELVARLDGQGLPPAQAMRLLDCVVAFTVGKVQAEVRQPVGGDGVVPEQALAAMTETAPHLARALATGYGWQPDDEFSNGLGALLAGWPVSSGSTAGS